MRVLNIILTVGLFFWGLSSRWCQIIIPSYFDLKLRAFWVLTHPITMLKDKHIKNSCQKRQVTCTSCDRSYDADAAEEHQKECPARIVPCRLCGEKVKKSLAGGFHQHFDLVSVQNPCWLMIEILRGPNIWGNYTEDCRTPLMESRSQPI